ncbi:channel protein TolC (plasmid) [Methylosinus sp. C49]|uniref:TolC family outer membrane protein n=1 Tax=Methylosinus sp. C49 TaxID=2699395 RepID=UPI00136793A4|nr:TolC family outer membrane protein [Methylosinus sp. C49]BBU63901.1 channel protein TolC [Methylosinus sp. C49]
MKIHACIIIGLTAVGAILTPASAETLPSALASAYAYNPDLNQQRASVRVHDESVAKAWSGLRPNASVIAGLGAMRTELLVPTIRLPFMHERIYLHGDHDGNPQAVTVNVSQTLFDGGRTLNNVKKAESTVLSARANLRLIEQAVLQNAATAYMDVLRDTAILSLRQNNIRVLELQLANTRENAAAGYLTETDVAQAEAAVSQARSDLYGAQARLKRSAASYHRIVGEEPKRLQPAGSVEKLLPRSVEDAIAIATGAHPGVEAAHHQVDAAEFAVHAAEADLLPSASVSGQLSQQNDFFLGLPGWRQFSYGVNVNFRVPLYQGGADFASVRQAKEQVGQARFGVDMQMGDARANVVGSYASLEAAKLQMKSDHATVKAAELALNGVREEAKVGLRTTLDVLNAQQSLLHARVNVVVSQHDVVVASYAALASIGRLNRAALNLDVEHYDAEQHFENVRGKFFGVDTP